MVRYARDALDPPPRPGLKAPEVAARTGGYLSASRVGRWRRTNAIGCTRPCACKSVRAASRVKGTGQTYKEWQESRIVPLAAETRTGDSPWSAWAVDAGGSAGQLLATTSRHSRRTSAYPRSSGASRSAPRSPRTAPGRRGRCRSPPARRRRSSPTIVVTVLTRRHMLVRRFGCGQRRTVCGAVDRRSGGHGGVGKGRDQRRRRADPHGYL